MNNAEIRLLVGFNRWANRRLLQAAARLDEDRLHAVTWLSHRSVHGVLLHMLETQRFWRQAAQEGYADAKPLAFPDFAALRTFWEVEDQVLNVFVAGLDEERLRAEVSFRWRQARPRRAVLWTMLMHIVNHGTQHRGELGQYLASIGCPVGGVNFLSYARKHGNPAP